MKTQPLTISDIFDLFGGPAEFARQFGLTTEHATLMRRRNSIPVTYWKMVVDHARKTRGLKRITWESLDRAHRLAKIAQRA
jgi:hypothetical protein